MATAKQYHDILAPEPGAGAGRLVGGDVAPVQGEDPGVHTRPQAGAGTDPTLTERRGTNSPESAKLLEEANTRTASAAEGVGGKAC